VSKAEFLHKMFGAEWIDAFREFKPIWDPDGKMILERSSIPIASTNLRLGRQPVRRYRNQANTWIANRPQPRQTYFIMALRSFPNSKL